jgi:hypothetical protein
MKAIKNISGIVLLALLFGTINQSLYGQVVINTLLTDPPEIQNSGLQITSSDGGLLIPFISLDYDEGKIAAQTIPSPADGLIIFHDGSHDITKGLWFYDATIPGWYLYSSIQSEFENDLSNYGEMYEANALAGGSLYDISNTGFTPWNTAQSGLMGPEFNFLDNATVNTETGTALADQVMVTGANAVYSVNVATTIVSKTSGNQITGQLFINDTPVDKIFFRFTFQTKNRPSNCFASGLIDINTNDKLDFRFNCSTAAEQIMIEQFNIRITKVGEL